MSIFTTKLMFFRDVTLTASAGVFTQFSEYPIQVLMTVIPMIGLGLYLQFRIEKKYKFLLNEEN